MNGNRQGGFTLIEAMIVVAIIAILAAIAYPSYTEYVLRGNRTEGMALLNEAAARQERYFAQNNTYTDTVADLNMNAQSPHGYYTLSISNVGANTYTLTAATANSQTRDTKCGNLGLDQAGAKSESGTAGSWEGCWK